MAIELSKRIESIMTELDRASENRWSIRVANAMTIRTVEAVHHPRTNKRLNSSEVRVRKARKTHSPGVAGQFQAFHKKSRRAELKRIAPAVAQIKYSKEGAVNLIPHSLDADLFEKTTVEESFVFCKYSNKIEVTDIVENVNKRVGIVERQIGYLLNQIWQYDNENINKHFGEILHLNNAIEKYIILDNSWSKRNKIKREPEKIENLKVFSNKMQKFQIAYSARSQELEIPDEIYNEMSFEEKIKSFSFLGDDWDDEGAKNVSKTAIKNALSFLKKYSDIKPCFVCATYEGKVGIDFKNQNLRLETQIVSSEYVKCLIIENRKKIIFNEVIKQDKFNKLLKKLK